MEIELHDLREDYVRLCDLIARTGNESAPRGISIREWIGVTLELDSNAHTLPTGVGRMVNTRLAAVESLCMIGGTWRNDLVQKAAPSYGDVLVSQAANDAEYAAYGNRTKDQVGVVIQQLKADPDTRQAILSIWQPRDLTHVGDKPCTLTLQFILRGDELHCITTMRSQDVWLGLAMDVFVFTQMQLTIANQLGVRSGRYMHHVGSLHAYTRDIDKITAMRTSDTLPAINLPRGVIGFDPPAQACAILEGKQDRKNPWYSTQVQRVLEAV